MVTMHASSPLPPYKMSSPWKPRHATAVSPFQMRTLGAKCGYLIGFPLLYYLFYLCFAGYFSFVGKVSITVAWGLYHIVAPVLIYTYEAWHNPYAFAPQMWKKASHSEEVELLEANRRVLRWYWSEGGPMDADYDRRPPGIGYRESSLEAPLL